MRACQTSPRPVLALAWQPLLALFSPWLLPGSSPPAEVGHRAIFLASLLSGEETTHWPCWSPGNSRPTHLGPRSLPPHLLLDGA